MLSLPLTSSPLRELFELATLVDYQKLPDFRRAVSACRNTVQQRGIRSVHSVCMRAAGEIVLIKVGKRGGVKQLWNFGCPVK